jgi:hypothetical protein
LIEGIDLASLRAGLAALFPAADPMSADVSNSRGRLDPPLLPRPQRPRRPPPSIVVMRYPDELSPEAELPS